MKKLFLILLLVFTTASAHAEDQGYLWDIPLGIPMSEAEQRFSDVIGYSLTQNESNLTADVLISGAKYTLALNSDETGTVLQEVLISSSIQEKLILADFLAEYPDVFPSAYRLLNMLIAKFGQPSFTGWVFPVNNERSIYFDLPVSSDGFVYETLMSVPDPAITSAIIVSWDHVEFVLSAYTITGESSSWLPGVTKVSFHIMESDSNVLPVYEYAGQYSEKYLLSNFGITSF